MTIGVLALQGDVREHIAALADLGEVGREVRGPADLDGLAGIILAVPGGESTTLSLLLGSSGLFDPLAEALAAGLAVFGTCAGMILLADTVLDGRPDQLRFGVIDITVRRNGYGRQVASFECDLNVAGIDEPPVHAVFIRAPVVEALAPGVQVLATLPDRVEGGGAARRNAGGGPVVYAGQGSVLVTAFHPELTGDRRLHQLFVSMIKEDQEPLGDVGTLQVGDHQASEGRQGRGPGQGVRQDHPPGGGGRPRGRQRHDGQRQPADHVRQGPRCVGADRHHRTRDQAGIR